MHFIHTSLSQSYGKMATQSFPSYTSQLTLTTDSSVSECRHCMVPLQVQKLFAKQDTQAHILVLNPIRTL